MSVWIGSRYREGEGFLSFFFFFFPCSSVGGWWWWEGKGKASRISPLGVVASWRERKKGFAVVFFIITLLLPVLLQHRYSFHKKNIFSREKNSRSQPNN